MIDKEFNHYFLIVNVFSWMKTIFHLNSERPKQIILVIIGQLHAWVCRKLLTAAIDNRMHKRLKQQNLLPKEQKVRRYRSLRTNEQLWIDDSIKTCKRRTTNLSMAWIDFQNAYDMVPYSWMLESLSLVSAAENVTEVLKNSMKQLRTNPFSAKSRLGPLNTNRVIFKGDSLSPVVSIVNNDPMNCRNIKMKQAYL